MYDYELYVKKQDHNILSETHILTSIEKISCNYTLTGNRYVQSLNICINFSLLHSTQSPGLLFFGFVNDLESKYCNLKQCLFFGICKPGNGVPRNRLLGIETRNNYK